MSNGRDLNTPNETEKALSIALIGLAGVLFAGLMALWPGLLSSLSHAGLLYSNIAVILILACLGISMFFGGRGYAYGPKHAGWMDRFNLQAFFGAIAIALILVLAAIMFATTEPSPSEKLTAKQTEIETRVSQLAKTVEGISNDLSDLKKKVDAADLSDPKKRLDAAEKSLSGLDRATSGYSTKTNEIDNSLKSLADRVEKLELNANQAKP
jgi:outer membrane murein-binding lipoprotein Lpp